MKPITKAQAQYIRSQLSKVDEENKKIRRKWNEIVNTEEFSEYRDSLVGLLKERKLSYKVFKTPEYKDFLDTLNNNNISINFAINQIKFENGCFFDEISDISISMTCRDKSKGKRKKRYLTDTDLSKKLLSDYERDCVKIIYDSNFPDKYKKK